MLAMNRTAHDEAAWQELARELDAWAAAGRGARLWWRDDDAGPPCPALDKLLDLSARSATPLALAAIPARVDPGLARALAGHNQICVLQHGYEHVNHAPQGGPAFELDAVRPEQQVMAVMLQGLEVLRDVFGGRCLAVMVPPWTHVAPGLLGPLARAGYVGLSCQKPRPQPRPGNGPLMVNVHGDLLSYRGGAHFIGEAAILGDIIGHLEDKRQGAADPDEPTGLVTHHQDMTDPAWEFMARFIGVIHHHPAAQWLSPLQIWPKEGA